MAGFEWLCVGSALRSPSCNERERLEQLCACTAAAKLHRMPNPSDFFAQALGIAATRADRESTSHPAKGIVLSIASLRSAGEVFRKPDLRAVYNADPLATFTDFQTRAESIYQNVHRLCEATALLIESAESIGGKPNLGGQLRHAAATKHPFAAALGSRSREIELLQWLATVRNKAIQHAASNGYTDNKGVMARAGFVMIRAVAPPDSKTVHKARALLVGLTRQFGAADDPGSGAQEAIAFLDLASHKIYRDHPGRVDPARRIVMDAKVHYIVVSSDMLDNVAWALGRVLELLPEHPRSV